MQHFLSVVCLFFHQLNTLLFKLHDRSKLAVVWPMDVTSMVSETGVDSHRAATNRNVNLSHNLHFERYPDRDCCIRNILLQRSLMSSQQLSIMFYGTSFGFTLL